MLYHIAVRTFWITLVAAIVLSIAAALLADALLSSRIAIIGDFAGLQYSTNPGVAFGVRLPPMLQPVFIVLALGLVSWFAHTQAESRISQIAFGLILGGAIGNVIDRLPDGVVTDFFQVGGFPIFNVADSCISIGAALLFLEAVRPRRHRKGSIA